MAKLQPGERLYRGLTSTRAVSTLGVAIWLPLGLLRAMYRQASTGNAFTPVVVLVIVVAMAIAGIGASWLVRVLLLRDQDGYRAGILRTFIGYLGVLSAVGVVQEATERMFGLGLGFSLGRVVTGVGGLYLVAFLLDSFDRYSNDISRLSHEQRKLSGIREASVRDLIRMRELIVSKLRVSWQDSWEDVHERMFRVSRATLQSHSLSTGADQEFASHNVAEIHDLADEIRDELIAPVRILSYEIPTADYLRGNVQAESVEASATDDRWIDRREVAASIPTEHPFYPFSVALLLGVFSLSNIEIFPLIDVIVASCAIFIGGFALLSLAKFLFGGWLEHTTVARAWIAWTVVVFAISAALAQVARWALGRAEFTDLWLFFLGALLVVSVIMIWSLLTAIYAKVQETKRSLELAAESSRREAVVVEQEVELTRQEVAHVLHGEVQSMLTAAAFRLDLAAENLEAEGSQEDLLVALDEANAMLEGASQKVDSISSVKLDLADDSPQMTVQDQVDVRERIDDVRVAWSGIVEIEVDVEDDAAVRLGTRVNDASLAPVVTDIVREAVLNAARHAHAAHIRVTITQADDLCHIEIANDGESPMLPVTPGMGFGMLERLECGWSLDKRIPHGSILTVNLPFLDI